MCTSGTHAINWWFAQCCAATELSLTRVAHSLVHSHTAKLIDELSKAGKPYQLQVFPSERHGVRTPHASKHLEIALVSFVLNHL
jgi:hypothetical protein